MHETVYSAQLTIRESFVEQAQDGQGVPESRHSASRVGAIKGPLPCSELNYYTQAHMSSSNRCQRDVISLTQCVVILFEVERI